MNVHQICLYVCNEFFPLEVIVLHVIFLLQMTHNWRVGSYSNTRTSPSHIKYHVCVTKKIESRTVASKDLRVVTMHSRRSMIKKNLLLVLRCVGEFYQSFANLYQKVKYFIFSHLKVHLPPSLSTRHKVSFVNLKNLKSVQHKAHAHF